MAQTSIALDDRLETAMFAYPFKAGWVDSGGMILVNHLSPKQASDATIALIDSVAALTMLDTHVILRDASIVSRSASMLTLTTHTRPDDVDNVMVSIAGVSPAGRAVVTAVLEPFYGIVAGSWSEDEEEVSQSTANVTEGPQALQAVENEEYYQEDLGRAWFLMTNKPFVSHVCVTRRSLLASEPATVVRTIERLLNARETGQERGREVRRDLSKALGVDRETLTDVLADQRYDLDDESIDGLAELAQRSGLGVSKRALQSGSVRVLR